jgi:hypothetical protein
MFSSPLSRKTTSKRTFVDKCQEKRYCGWSVTARDDNVTQNCTMLKNLLRRKNLIFSLFFTEKIFFAMPI